MVSSSNRNYSTDQSKLIAHKQCLRYFGRHFSLEIETSVNCLWKCPQQTEAAASLALHLDDGINRSHQCPLLLMKNSSIFLFFALGLVKEYMGRRRFARYRPSLDCLTFCTLLLDVRVTIEGLLLAMEIL